MKDEINRGILLYAVQRKMFCPECKTVLDVRTAVHTSRGASDAGVVTCGGCFDEVAEQFGPEVRARLDIIDGRELC